MHDPRYKLEYLNRVQLLVTVTGEEIGDESDKHAEAGDYRYSCSIFPYRTKMCRCLTNDSILPIHVYTWKHFLIKAWLIKRCLSNFVYNLYNPGSLDFEAIVLQGASNWGPKGSQAARIYNNCAMLYCFLEVHLYMTNELSLFYGQKNKLVSDRRLAFFYICSEIHL